MKTTVIRQLNSGPVEAPAETTKAPGLVICYDEDVRGWYILHSGSGLAVSTHLPKRRAQNLAAQLGVCGDWTLDSAAVCEYGKRIPVDIRDELRGYTVPKVSRRMAEYMRDAEDNIGRCRACGAEQGGCEPDARNYKCEACGKREVFGLEELMTMGEIA